jgi:two-component system chemotaxis response regulator CheY
MTAETAMKILVVDDFSATRQVVINTLEQFGFNNIEEVADGYSALVRLKSALFDFVIMDWGISQMSGLDLLKQIRADPELKHIPVLMVTEDHLQENVVVAIKAGLNDYIIRPFEANIFAEKLEKIFQDLNLP